MERQGQAGLQLHIPPAAHPLWQRLSPAIPPLLLYGALVLSFWGLTGAAPGPLVPLAGALVPVAGTIFAKKTPVAALPALLALSLAALFLWPPAFEGGKLLLHRLYSASEGVNAYAYIRLTISVPEADHARCISACTLVLSILIGAFCALVAGKGLRIAAVAVFLLISLAEVYFGVTPGPAVSLLVYTALGLVLVHRPDGSAKTNAGTAALFLAAVLALSALISTAAPGTDPRIEGYSELLRDRLAHTEQGVYTALSQTAQSLLQTRRENRLDEQAAGGVSDEAQRPQDYGRQEEHEHELSRPERTSFGRIALLSLLILALLVVPFLPFALLDARRRRAAEKRAAFTSDQYDAAIQAMFLHLMAWLEAAGLEKENRLFSQRLEKAAGLLPQALAEECKNAVPLWQEAAYSGHPMTQAQCAQLQALLRKTEETIYTQSGRLKRLRLKYIDLLVE